MECFAVAHQLPNEELLAQNSWIVPIPGTTILERFEENIGAVYVGLSLNDLQEIEQISTQVQAQGDRYPEDLERLTYR